MSGRQITLTACDGCGLSFSLRDLHLTKLGLLCEQCADREADSYWASVEKEKDLRG